MTSRHRGGLRLTLRWTASRNSLVLPMVAVKMQIFFVCLGLYLFRAGPIHMKQKLARSSVPSLAADICHIFYKDIKKFKHMIVVR